MLSEIYFPGQPVTSRTMGLAYAREKNYWERMEIATANAIARALNGDE